MASYLKRLTLRRRPGVALLLAAFALVSAALATTTDLWLYRLPDPATADREGLLRWMALRDLSQEPPEVRDLLIRRFEEELDKGLEFSSRGEVKESYRQQVRRNIRLLVVDWFRKGAQRYEATPPRERTELLEQQIAKLQRWNVVEMVLAASAGGKKQLSDLERLMAFDNWAQGWIAEAAPQEQPLLRNYVTALEGQLVARKLPKLW